MQQHAHGVNFVHDILEKYKLATHHQSPDQTQKLTCKSMVATKALAMVSVDLKEIHREFKVDDV